MEECTVRALPQPGVGPGLRQAGLACPARLSHGRWATAGPMLQSRAVQPFWMSRAGQQVVASGRFRKPCPGLPSPESQGGGPWGLQKLPGPGHAQACGLATPTCHATCRTLSQGLHSEGLPRDPERCEAGGGRPSTSWVPQVSAQAPPLRCEVPVPPLPASAPGPAPRRGCTQGALGVGTVALSQPSLAAPGGLTLVMAAAA